MGRVLVGLFRAGVLIGIFTWVLSVVALSHSLQGYVDGLLTSFAR